jgi:hypothetical protein
MVDNLPRSYAGFISDGVAERFKMRGPSPPGWRGCDAVSLRE